MTTYLKAIAAWLLITVGIISLLTGCNGGSDGNATLSGTTASGAAIDGIVYVRDRNGIEVNTATAANGGWSVSVQGMAGPFLIRVVPNGVGDVLYSYSALANRTVNITPLTHLAMFLAYTQGDLSALYNTWAQNYGDLTTTAIENAQARINANFASQFDTAGLDYTVYDFFSAVFTGGSATGIDAVLDGLQISINFTTGSFVVAINGLDYTFDLNIDISGISIGGGSGGGSGGGGGSTTFTCDTTQYTAGAVSTPTTGDVAGFAATYSGQEGSIGPNPGDPFVASGAASFVLNADGTATYNGTTYTITSYCLDNSVSLLYVMDASGSHFDLFGNGDVYGVTSGGSIVQPGGGGSGSGSGTTSGSVTAPLAPLANGAYYRLVYSAGMDVGIDQRKATANFSGNGAMSDYAVILFDGSTSTQEAPSLGTASVAELAGDDKVTIGRWNGGTTAGSFYSISPIAITANQGFHYAIGVPPASLPADGASKCYALTAATHPTIGDGSVAPGSVTPGAQVKIIFGATGGLAIDMTFTVGSNMIAVQTPGGMASPITFGSNGASYSASSPAPVGYTSIDSANNTTSAYIFLAGANSERLGMSFTRYQGAGGNSASLQGAAYFSETACQ